MNGKVKFKANKLVRRKTQEQLESVGIHCEMEILKRGKYLFFLKRKLTEEAGEVLRTRTKEELIDEMGDVLSIFHLILKEYGISMSQVLDGMQNKEKARGPIGNYFMATFDVPEGHELMEKYEKSYKKAEE